MKIEMKIEGELGNGDWPTGHGKGRDVADVSSASTPSSPTVWDED